MARKKSVRNQKLNNPQEKPEQQETAPSAADFLNQQLPPETDRGNDSADDTISGVIEDVQIHDHALSEEEVKEAYQTGNTDTPAETSTQTRQEDQTDASADYSEANQPEQSAEEPETVPPAAPPEPAPKPEPAKTDAKPKQNVRETKQSARLGDPCPVEGCPGNIISYSRSRNGTRVTHFLECSNCKTKPTPSKQVINYGH